MLSVKTIGQSHEGRDLKVVKLSHKEGNPGIFVDANIHAREWITSATVTWILNELLTSDDPAVRDLAENFDWYIVPVLNPDGFVYTHTTVCHLQCGLEKSYYADFACRIVCGERPDIRTISCVTGLTQIATLTSSGTVS